MTVELTAAVEHTWVPDKDSSESRRALAASASDIQEPNVAALPRKGCHIKGLYLSLAAGALLLTGGVVYAIAEAAIRRWTKQAGDGIALVNRVAFSSCTQRNFAPNPIWEQVCPF
jgi:hypothetical protein